MSSSDPSVAINDVPFPALPSLIVIITAAAATDETTVATDMEAPSLSASPSRVVGDEPCFGRPKWRATMDHACVCSICLRVSSRSISITSSASGH